MESSDLATGCRKLSVSEPGELAVPRSGYPGLVFGLKGVYRTLGQGQLTLAVFSVDVP